MDYANLPGLAAAGMAGLMAGAAFGRKVSSELMTTIEARLAAAEKQFSEMSGGTAAAAASIGERYAAAVEKLAGAIEKHAAAIDDHGAATVAAAVEGHAALEPAGHAMMMVKSPIA